jgi:hypothetical protein
MALKLQEFGLCFAVQIHSLSPRRSHDMVEHFEARTRQPLSLVDDAQIQLLDPQVNLLEMLGQTVQH